MKSLTAIVLLCNYALVALATLDTYESYHQHRNYRRLAHTHQRKSLGIGRNRVASASSESSGSSGSSDSCKSVDVDEDDEGWQRLKKIVKPVTGSGKPSSSPSQSQGSSSSSSSSSSGSSSDSPTAANTNSGLQLINDYTGQKFFDGFEFFTYPDPTNGNVDYVADTSLAYVNNQGNIILKTDNSSNVSGNRRSIRMTSKIPLEVGQLMIADVNHMPATLASWPALWTCGPNWPNGGEIDIIEGVNTKQVNNQMTLHTNAGCTSSPIGGSMLGQKLLDNCDANINNNMGCSTLSESNESFGVPLNDNGGGVYALSMANEGIKIWFFPRANLPKDIVNGSPDPSNWSTPSASWSSSTCSMSYFGPQTIVINNTLCGQWAGAVYNQDGGQGSCQQYVETGDFDEAYWDIGYVRTYALA